MVLGANIITTEKQDPMVSPLIFNKVSRDEPSSVAYNKVSYNPKDYYCDKTSTIGQMTIPDS